MKLPIELSQIKKECEKCPNFKGINHKIVGKIYEISCIGNGEIEEDNCKACVNTLNFVGEKFDNYLLLYSLARYYSR